MRLSHPDARECLEAHKNVLILIVSGTVHMPQVHNGVRERGAIAAGEDARRSAHKEVTDGVSQLRLAQIGAALDGREVHAALKPGQKVALGVEVVLPALRVAAPARTAYTRHRRVRAHNTPRAPTSSAM